MATQVNPEVAQAYEMAVGRIERHNERAAPQYRKKVPTLDEFMKNYSEALADFVVACIANRSAPSRQYAAGRLN